MPNTVVQAAAEGMPVDLRKALFGALADIEGDMREVFDHALILDDKLGERGRISVEMQHALSWSSSRLVTLGRALHEHFDRLHALTREGGAA